LFAQNNCKQITVLHYAATCNCRSIATTSRTCWDLTVTSSNCAQAAWLFHLQGFITLIIVCSHRKKWNVWKEKLGLYLMGSIQQGQESYSWPHIIIVHLDEAWSPVTLFVFPAARLRTAVFLLPYIALRPCIRRVTRHSSSHSNVRICSASFLSNSLQTDDEFM